MQRIIILIYCIFPICCWSQINAELFIDGRFSSKRAFRDTVSLNRYIENKKIEWINDGFLFCGLDSIEQRENLIRIYFHNGEKFDAEISGIKSKSLWRGLSKVVDNYANNGFPFASVQIDSTYLDKGGLRGIAQITKGPEIRYDSAFFFDEVKTNPSYIFRLLELVPGELFNESDYTKIDDRIRRSSFLFLNRPSDISFSGNKAKVFLDINEQSTSSFQGILGLQQNQNGSSSLVGSLDLSVQNLFRLGHEFHFFWESFAEASQQLDLSYKHAFLFNANFSPSFRFELTKQDTTFLTRTTGIGVNTYIGSDILFLVEYEGSNGSLISSDIEILERRNLADFQRNLYRVQLSRGFQGELNSFNQGIIWSASLGVGNKIVKNNVSLPSSYYDTISLKTDFIRLEGQTAYQLKIGRRQTVYHDLQIGLLDNSELLTNELYRIGGLSSLRGFNEKNFFASQYALSRFEFRSFFEDNSYLYAFYDQLAFKRTAYFDYPFGIGVGFVLETSASQFSFALASGKSSNQNISFSELRAHFGFVTKF